jgi:ABC-type amino acid transport substrate-binding protein
MSKHRLSLVVLSALVFALLLIALVALPSLIGTGAPARDEVFLRIVERGTLRVGLDASFPPFESLGEQQTLQGFDVELADELARRLNLRAEFVTTGFDALYPELAAEHFDVIISALPFDRTRTRDVAYSDIYLRGGEVLVRRAADPAVKGLPDLQGQVVGVELGSNAETVAHQFERRNGYRVQSFENLDDAARALESGAVRAIVADAVSARLLRRTHDSLAIVEPPVGDEPNYVVAMPVNAPQLLASVNRQLRAMDRDGTLRMLVDKWF